MGREGTWSGNASVPLRPATSYHGASADRWMQESPIIEMLGHKRPDEGEELLRASWCVRMARGSQGSAVSATATHHTGWCEQVKTCVRSDLSQRDWFTFWFRRARFSTVTMETCTLSLDLLFKMANFTLLACFCCCACDLFLNVLQLPRVINKVFLRNGDLMWEQLTSPRYQNVFDLATAFRRLHDHTACSIKSWQQEHLTWVSVCLFM